MQLAALGLGLGAAKRPQARRDGDAAGFAIDRGAAGRHTSPAALTLLLHQWWRLRRVIVNQWKRLRRSEYQWGPVGRFQHGHPHAGCWCAPCAVTPVPGGWLAACVLDPLGGAARPPVSPRIGGVRRLPGPPGAPTAAHMLPQRDLRRAAHSRPQVWSRAGTIGVPARRRAGRAPQPWRQRRARRARWGHGRGRRRVWRSAGTATGWERRRGVDHAGGWRRWCDRARGARHARHRGEGHAAGLRR